MNKHILPSALFCAVALAFAAPLSAQEPVPPVDPVPAPAMEADVETNTDFEALDTNQDGFIEKTDVPVEHELSADFASADANGDSRLDRVEFDAYVDAPEEEEAEE